MKTNSDWSEACANAPARLPNGLPNGNPGFQSCKSCESCRKRPPSAAGTRMEKDRKRRGKPAGGARRGEFWDRIYRMDRIAWREETNSDWSDACANAPAKFPDGSPKDNPTWAASEKHLRFPFYSPKPRPLATSISQNSFPLIRTTFSCWAFSFASSVKSSPNETTQLAYVQFGSPDFS